MSGAMSVTCKRCAKEFTGPSCPYCTVTGVDLEALLNAEEMQLLHVANKAAPVVLVDMVTKKSIAVITPLCKIGRDLANDIPLTGDRSMSRFHFQIRQTGQDYYVEDCGSRNGTFLNGSPIAIPRKLHNGDIISAGISRYQFTIQSEKKGEAGSEAPETGRAGRSSEKSITSADISEARDALQKLRGTVAEPVEVAAHEYSSQQAESPQTVDAALTEDAAQSDDADQPPDPDEVSGSAEWTDSPECPQSPERPESKRHDESEETTETVIAQALIETMPSAVDSGEEDRSAREAVHFGPIDQSSPPAWLDEYLFPEIQKLMSEKVRLTGLLEEVRQDIKQIDRKIASAQGISQALLSGSGPDLAQACRQVFDSLEWTADSAANNQFELTLKKAPKIEAVVKTVICQSEPSAKDFEALVNQQAVVWCQSNYEPKGIMVVQMRPEIQPSQRPPLSKDFLESMRRKKICVVQPTQLLAIYRLVTFGGHDKSYFRDLFLTTCGPLSGFMMKPLGNRAATV
jgi:pSer/pThr/pTyr-binding forkhead associated (FHA) protein